MRAGQRQWLRGIAWLTVGLICWCCAMGLLATKEVMAGAAQVSYRQPRGTTTAEQMRTLISSVRAKNQGDAAGWAQTLAQSVSVASLDSATSVDVLWAQGDVALIWNLPLVAGHLPLAVDTTGCAIDAETALLLFGSTDVVGQSVQLGDIWLTVRGVFTLPTGGAFMDTNPGRGILFAPASLAPEEESITAMAFIVYDTKDTSATEQVLDWMRDADISTSGSLTNLADEVQLLDIVKDIPVYLLILFIVMEVVGFCIHLCKRAVGQLRMLRENPLSTPWVAAQTSLPFAAAALLALGGLWITIALLPAFRVIPATYMPTAWSDFAFWPDRIAQGMKEAALQKLEILHRPDMVRESLTKWFWAMLLMSTFCLWHGRNRVRRGAAQQSTYAIVFSMFVLIAAVPVGLSAATWIGGLPTASAHVLLPALLAVLIPLLRKGANLPYERIMHYRQKGEKT